MVDRVVGGWDTQSLAWRAGFPENQRGCSTGLPNTREPGFRTGPPRGHRDEEPQATPVMH